MGLKLHAEKSDGTISVLNMSKGQFGRVTQWGRGRMHLGHIIIRGSSHLTSLPDGDMWSDLCDLDDTCRVRILPPGTLLEVE